MINFKCHNCVNVFVVVIKIIIIINWSIIYVCDPENKNKNVPQ